MLLIYANTYTRISLSTCMMYIYTPPAEGPSYIWGPIYEYYALAITSFLGLLDLLGRHPPPEWCLIPSRKETNRNLPFEIP